MRVVVEMIYPDDPNGSFGPEYPKGFELWFALIVVALILLGIGLFR